MKTEMTKLYVQAMKWNSHGAFKTMVNIEKMHSCNLRVVIDICERIIDLKIPETDPALFIAAEVGQIEAAIAEEIAKSTRKIKEMQEKRASLLSLENKTEQK